MTSNKRYQVFLSSTYNDLKEERQEVISALIKRKCFPIAMEYFPAMNRKSIDYIKDAIKECDFYILIVAGRYGSSRDDNGVSLTEIEFDYAQELKIPTNIYLYDGPPLPSDKIEENDEGKERLRSFIQKLKATEYGYATWSNKDKLASEVKDGIEELKSSSSAVGWVRADKITQMPQTQDSCISNDSVLQALLDFPLTFRINVYRHTYPHSSDPFDFTINDSNDEIELYASVYKTLPEIFPNIVQTVNTITANTIEPLKNPIIRSVFAKHAELPTGLSLKSSTAQEIINEMLTLKLLKRDDKDIFRVTELGAELYRTIQKNI